MIAVPKRLGGGSKLNDSQRRSSVQEKQTAKRLGGKVAKQSGGGLFEKGDVRVKGLVKVECKTTKHKSFSVTRELIDKIEGQSVMAGELPVMDIEIDGGAKSVYVMPKWAMESLMDELHRLRGDKD